MHFVTYFDGHYAPRALVMLRSLSEVSPGADVLALALDARAAALARSAPIGTRVVALDALLRADPMLAQARAAAPERGFLMALKPSWLAFALADTKQGSRLSYVDADLYFMASPQAAIAESPSAAVLLSPHRFPNQRPEAGLFNAGWISLSNDARARSFLCAWQRDCAGRMSPVYSNQRFLDRAITEYPGVGVLAHPGVNVAPWNVRGRALSERDGALLVDGVPLVAYHMSGLEPVGFRRCLAGSLRGRDLDGLLRARVYEPYLRRLRSAAGELRIDPARALDRVEWPTGLRERWKHRAALWRRLRRGGGLRF